MSALLELDATAVWALAALVALAVVLPYAIAFRRARRHDRARLQEARALGIDLPVAQFPFIDPQDCIGCGACVRACPEGDVLGVVGGTAVVINGLRCVGHGRCADACPVAAIEIGLGDLKGRRDLPVLSPDFESSVPGIFVAGELTGMALIRNAVEQGTRVVATIAARRRRDAAPTAPGTHDLVIVGAGPAGLSAALAAREQGLDALVVDQSDGLGGTILHFPRRKLVLTRPVGLPGGAALVREEYSKEELLELLQGEVARQGLAVRFGERMVGIERQGEVFAVRTRRGTHLARFVILSLGRRGTPRKLGVPGEERSKVMYQLRDAESYRGQRILVVGGGDSAIEAAVGLARQAGNRVTLSYRKNSFYRIKKKNQDAIEGLMRRGKIRAVFESAVESIEEGTVDLRVGERNERLENDYVFVLIGGDPPFDLLRGIGLAFGGEDRSAGAPPGKPRTAAVAMLALGLLWGALGARPLGAQQNPHGDLAVACDQCHTTEDWTKVGRDIPFRHDATGFPLAGMHAVAACAECHRSPVFAHVGTACQDCHQDVHAGELGSVCANCHDTRRWDVRADLYHAHNQTIFPLLAAHARVDCEACHGGQPPTEYSRTPIDCYACHRASYEAATSPPHDGFSTDCRQCHIGVTDDWHRTTFQHTARFPLTGAHGALGCEDCHRQGYTGTQAECYACHRPDYEGARDPNHVAGNFSTTCQSCHSTSSWSGAVFDHSTSRFPLVGAHRTIACADCHTQGYTGTPADCYACHRSDYNAARDPNHASAGFPTVCQACHDMRAWEPAAFDHATSRFPLTGAHRTIACADCHTQGYTGTPADCSSCHQDEYNATRNPDHRAAGYPTTCQNCHSTNSWEGATFQHTTFPLQGAHRTVACESCHTNGYAGTPRDCYSCHRPDYDATTNPNHRAANFPTTCESCHTVNGWSGASFNHSTFPLTGAHQSAACASCHAGGYAGTPRDCYACHRTDYDGTTDPNHRAGGFATTCESCHNTTSWEGATTEHTSWPLTGAHRTTPCASCHATGYEGTPRACVGCHQSDYQGVTDPNHVTAGFPTTCESCHSTTTWNGATFNHASTGWPLTGAHTSASCQSCHAGGYAGTPTACFACHQSDYQGVTDPNHVTAGFPTTCESCHSTTTWNGATFNHASTGWPLTGAHTSASCQSCHAGGYQGTPTECFACHQSDYQGATDPNHVAAGFPTTCQTCHTTTSWEGATFNHDAAYFPIYSGRHRNEWNACSDCHVSAGNYQHFECIFCHEHNRAEMDNEHSDVGGYVYASPNCYSCHPRGEADD